MSVRAYLDNQHVVNDLIDLFLNRRREGSSCRTTRPRAVHDRGLEWIRSLLDCRCASCHLDIDGIDAETATLHFHSWEQLSSAENVLTTSITGAKEVQIAFRVDEQVAGVLIVVTKSDVGDTARLTGKAIWL